MYSKISWKCLHYQSSTYKHHSRQIKTRKLKVLKTIFWREPYCLFPFSSSGNIVMSQEVLTTKLIFYHNVSNCLMFKQKTSRIRTCKWYILGNRMSHLTVYTGKSHDVDWHATIEGLKDKGQKKKWSPFDVTRQSHFLPLGHMGTAGSHCCLPRKGRTHSTEENEWSLMLYTEANVWN